VGGSAFTGGLQVFREYVHQIILGRIKTLEGVRPPEMHVAGAATGNMGLNPSRQRAAPLYEEQRQAPIFPEHVEEPILHCDACKTLSRQAHGHRSVTAVGAVQPAPAMDKQDNGQSGSGNRFWRL
jgi:hypothetical protein